MNLIANKQVENKSVQWIYLMVQIMQYKVNSKEFAEIVLQSDTDEKIKKYYGAIAGV